MDRPMGGLQKRNGARWVLCHDLVSDVCSSLEFDDQGDVSQAAVAEIQNTLDLSAEFADCGGIDGFFDH